jgi:hypothetical protein
MYCVVMFLISLYEKYGQISNPMVVTHMPKQHRPSDMSSELEIPREQHTVVLIF